MRARNEVQVGIAVVAALVLTVVGYFFLRGVGLGADIYHLRLDGPATLAPGNDVRLQGVRVGEVQDVVLDPDTQKPLLTLAIRHHNKLLKSYTYSINANALIGESYVDIKGVYDPNGALYPPNNRYLVIEGTTSAGIAGVTDQATQVLKDFRTTVGKFNITLDRINKGVLSYDNQVKLASALQNISLMTQKIGQSFGPQGIRFGFSDPKTQDSLNRTLAGTAEATTNLGQLISSNREQLHDLFVNLSHASNNVAGLTESLNFVVKNAGLKENTQAAMISMRKSAENIEAATSSVRNISTDPATIKDVHESLTALRQATESLRDTAKSINAAVSDPASQGQIRNILTTLNTTVATLQVTMENLKDASGGLKNVLGDPKVQSDLKDIPAELKSTLAAARDTAERLDSILGGRRGRNASDAASNGGTIAQTTHIGYEPGGFDFTYRHYLSEHGGPGSGDGLDGRNFGDLTFNSNLFGGPFRLGIDNIGEGDNLTAETGRFLGTGGALP